jgi:phosphoglycerate kinase
MLLPVDAVVAAEITDGAQAREVPIDKVPADMRILDIGEKSVALFETALKDCRTIIWNGPMGVFETPPFNKGTFALAEFLGSLDALTVVGGGDSASAVRQAKAENKVSYISTGGGAFLEMLEGKELPGVSALQKC